MAKPTLHSTPLSTYGRTCRMAFAEKGVAYDLDPVAPQTPEQKARHPWGSVPALTHGAARLYESLAICAYVDGAFDGPPLEPEEPLARARGRQWISVFIQYFYRPAIDIVLQRLVVPAQGGEADEALVADSLPGAEKALRVLDGALAGQAHFAGAAPSLADWFVLPLLHYLKMVPEGEKMLAAAPALVRWQAALDERESARETVPQFG